jgi:pseudo-rSAM protein
MGKMKNKNKYWLLIYPYVFIFNKGNIVLFYNSRFGSFTYCYSSEITDKLSNPDNLYSIPIYLKYLQDEKSYSLINNLIHQKCGELIPYDKDGTKPLSIFPKLIIDDYGPDDSSNRNYKRFSELKELILFINGHCRKNCKNCNISFKQHLWCHKQLGEIPFEKIRKFLSFLTLSGVLKISITGADIFSYPELEQLTFYLKQFPILKIFLIHSSLIIDNEDKLKWFVDNKINCDILFEPKCRKELIYQVVKIIGKFHITSRFIMSVTSFEEYEYANQLSSAYNLETKIVPIYNGKNRMFFEDNVFLNKDDIHNIKVSMREIFSHQFVNTNSFGRLILSTDEKIYVNINNISIGNINDDIHQLVNSQLKKGSGWRNVRNNSVCADCIYQWLCPSTSDYNIVLNQFNLCSVKLGTSNDKELIMEANHKF